MGRKRSRGSNARARRAKKRKFAENRHLQEEETTFARTSAQKLSKTGDEEIIIDPDHGYRIVAFLSVFTAISELVICKVCGEQVRFGESSVRCLGFQIAVQCKCGTKYIDSCPLIDNKAYEINRRLVLVMKLLGIGREGIRLFCGLMDLSQGISNTVYYAAIQNIHLGATAVFNILTKKAVNEEKIKNADNGNPVTDITVSGNGTWHKRDIGFLVGIITLIGKYTNKVIDLVIEAADCDTCEFLDLKRGTVKYDTWLDKHADECYASYERSAGKLEVDALKYMLRRSYDEMQVKYGKYIGDGDRQSFKALLDDKNVQVMKKECIKHIERRMGSRLRSIQKTQKLAEENKLTGKLIRKLTTSYRLALSKHSDSVDEMYNAVWATFYHNISTNENPQHTYCPVGSESWCKWRVAEANDTLNIFNHEPPLHEDVINAIKPIYEDLSSRELLERCLGGETLNNSERLHSIIWRFAPEHLQCGGESMEIAAYLAVGIFNEGFHTVLKTMSTIGIVIGEQAKLFTNAKEEQRLQTLARRNLEARIGLQPRHRADYEEFYEEEEILL